jgi:hypothetical protein
MDRLTWEESMEFRKPTPDERRLLLELARIAHIDGPEGWLDALQVRTMKDGGMGSLELVIGAYNATRSTRAVMSKASVQFSDEDGVQVVATLNANEDGVPFELDVWKTDFTPLKRIPDSFQLVED